MVRWGALLLVLLLAGCSQSPPDDSAAQEASRIEQADEAAAKVAVEATETTGVIRGVVVDQAIRPVADVLVAIEGTGLNQTTPGTGVFGFEGLEAGTYYLTATRLRYESVRLGVVVEAAKKDPEPVRVVMAALPGTEPFIESFKATLFVAFSAPLFGSLAPSDAGLEGDDRATFSIQPNATVIQMETSWDATTPTGEHIRMYASATDAGTPMEIKSIEGGSPLALRVNGTADGDIADGFYFGVGSLARGFTSTEAPDPNGYLVLNQEFEAFAHAFHNFLPRDDWLFVRDGEHPLPPP